MKRYSSLGFDTIWAYDHLLPINEIGQPFFDAWTILAILADSAKGMSVGSLVSPVTLRHPVMLAKIADTIQAFAGCRVEVGIGAGWNETEHTAFGIAFPSGRERGRMVLEAAEVLHRMWNQEPPPWAGTHFALDAGRRELTSTPRPQLLVGGRGRSTLLHAAAKYADTWNVSAPTVAEVVRLNRELDELCIAVGRDPLSLRRSIECSCIIGQTDRAVGDALIKVERRERRPLTPDRHLVGTPLVISQRVDEYKKAGISRFMLAFPAAELAQLESFSSEVLPSVREPGARDKRTQAIPTR